MGGRPVGYLQAWPRSWTRVYRETTPVKWSERDLKARPPDFKSSALTTWPHCLHLWLKTSIFLISTWSRGLAATLWLRGTTHTDSHDVHDKGLACFCNPLLVKSSITNNSPPMWLHLPFPYKPSPAGHMHAPCKMSLWGENSTITLYGFFFIDGTTLAFT